MDDDGSRIDMISIKAMGFRSRTISFLQEAIPYGGYLAAIAVRSSLSSITGEFVNIKISSIYYMDFLKLMMA